MTTPETTTRRPRPVATPQAITSVITFVVGQAIAFGLIPEATNAKVASAAPIVVGVVFAIMAALHSGVAVFSQQKVTPTSDPRAEVVQADGTKVLEPLVPLSLAVQAVPSQVGAVDLADDYADVTGNRHS